VSAAFWTWLWGPVGLLLSTPLTLCLVVLGRHVERLEFFNVILGDQPALTLQENFYQRMLASDPDEAARQAEDFLKEKSLSTYYDEVAVGGLALAQLDVNRGVLEHERRVRIKEAVLGVIDDLSDHTSALSPLKDVEAVRAAMPEGHSQKTAEASHGRTVMCVAGRGSLDEAAAAMLAQLLESQGVTARVVPSEAVATESIFQLEVTDVEMVCLSYLEPGGFTSARYLVRRLRRKLPSVPIIVGFWTLSEDDAQHRDALKETGADLVVTSLWRAVEQVTMTKDTVPHEQMLIERKSEVPPAAE
jgi:CheY-like chemotaxis protein